MPPQLRNGKATSTVNRTVPLWVFLVTNIFIYFITRNTSEPADSLHISRESVPKDLTAYALAIPEGTTPNLPSVQINDASVDKMRDRSGTVYGGKGDKVHLGGFTDIDLHGISPALWKEMVTEFGIKSLIDLGCGRGISTSWFLTHGVNAHCVEGSHDAVLQSMLPDPTTQLTEHDFSRGPWWPEKTQDAVWCVEFLEHVGRNFHHNYLPIFRKAALIFATHSIWGGWHHVEVHDSEWWIQKMQMYGFVYSERLTLHVRAIAKKEDKQKIPSVVKDQRYYAQHLIHNLLVFINPAVAALPQHAHLMAEPGCYNPEANNVTDRHKKCGTLVGGDTETPLPSEFEPIVLTPSMDTMWENLVKKHLESIAQ